MPNPKKVNESNGAVDTTAPSGKSTTTSQEDDNATGAAQGFVDALNSATTVKKRGEAINTDLKFADAFDDVMSLFPNLKGKATRGAIERRVREVLIGLGYK